MHIATWGYSCSAGFGVGGVLLLCGRGLGGVSQGGCFMVLILVLFIYK